MSPAGPKFDRSGAGAAGTSIRCRRAPLKPSTPAPSGGSSATAGKIEGTCINPGPFEFSYRIFEAAHFRPVVVGHGRTRGQTGFGMSYFGGHDCGPSDDNDHPVLHEL